jgi:hypothetical protein
VRVVGVIHCLSMSGMNVTVDEDKIVITLPLKDLRLRRTAKTEEDLLILKEKPFLCPGEFFQSRGLPATAQNRP